MPASPARVAANRANAQRSTGPRTHEGKAASKHNALKHGAHATDDSILSAPISAAPVYLADFTASFSPDGPVETPLVKRPGTRLRVSLAERLDLLSDGLDSLLALNQRKAGYPLAGADCLKENYDIGGPGGDLRDTPPWSAALRRFDGNKARYDRDPDPSHDPDLAACSLAYTLSSPRAAMLLRHDAAVERRFHATLAQLQRQQQARRIADRSPRYSSPQALLEALGISSSPSAQQPAPFSLDRIEANSVPDRVQPTPPALQTPAPISPNRIEANSAPLPPSPDGQPFQPQRAPAPVCPPALVPYPWSDPDNALTHAAPAPRAADLRRNEPNASRAT